MNKYFVIGNPIGHSLSPLIHNYWIKKYRIIDSHYEKRKIDEENLESFVNEVRWDDEIRGVNVTVPYKKKIIPFLDDLGNGAKNTQSVNTLLKENNKIVGFNTDCWGFYYSLKPFEGSHEGFFEKCFIIGAGGVTPSILEMLSSSKVYITNRTKQKAEQLKKQYPKIIVIDWGDKPEICDMVINTTSVGLTKEEKLDLDFNEYQNHNNTIFYDVIYNPKETNFLRDAKSRGNKIMNGKMMFLGQAKESFKMWTNVSPEIDDEVIKLIE